MGKQGLNSFLRDIERTFDRADVRGSRENSDATTRRANTNETYKTQTIAFAKFVYQNYGVSDARFLKPKHAEEYINKLISDEKSVSTVKTVIHSLGKYQSALRHQDKFRARVIDKQKMLSTVKEEMGVRSSDDARKGLIITPDQARGLINELENSSSPNAKEMAKVAEFQLETGSRVTASLRIVIKDIKFGSNIVRFVHDKGYKTREVKDIDPNYIQKLQKEVEGKKSGRQLFEFFDKDGNAMSLEDARRQYDNTLRRIVKKVGLVEETKLASTHSFRKAFAVGRAEKYRTTSYTQLKKELTRRMDADKSGRTKKRIKRELKKLANVTKEHLVKLLVSLDLGHNRLDVMRFYLPKTDKNAK